MKSTNDNNPDTEDETPKKNPFDGGGVKGATFSTEDKDNSLKEAIYNKKMPDNYSAS